MSEGIDTEQYQRFLQFIEKRKQFGAKGGRAKGSNSYCKFLSWVDETNFDISEFKNISIAKFTLLVNRKGCAISEVTAAKYRKRYLSQTI